ncbi:MAG: PD-(D/E)XK nuclease family protein, partial [Pseudomonadota bacterium]
DADSSRSAHLKRVERFEHGVLRAGLPTLSLDALPSDWIEGSGDQAWLAWLRRALTPGPPDEGAQDRWQRHMQAAQQLAHGPDGGGGHQEEAPSGALWQQAAGRRCRDVFYGLGDALEGRAPGLGALYPHILRAVLGGAEVADRASNAHPSLAILGPREARMESADVMILAGLNEDVWPRQPNPDPWLSRGMRAALGLTVPERQLGLAAHDFQQGTTGSELVLSRAVRDASAPTVPSRWLMRLTNLLSGLGETGTDALAQMRARGATLGAMAKALAPPRATPRATRPQPCPPAEARPARLSVTRVEALIRDPYAIYAAYVLGLRALDPLSRDADALLRGTAFHTVLQRFVEATRAGLPPGDQALALWDQTVAQTLAEQVPWRAERVFWTSRLSRAGPAFLASEADRRALGTPLVLEVMGTRAMADGRFTLSATADRIDRMPDGQLALYDYKSGDPPSDEALRTSSIQILLEAGIAAVGGFSGAPAATTGYAQIIGLKPEGKIREVPLDLAEDWPKVENLIAQVLNPAWPMTARLRPGQVVDHTYDHLSRLGEWEDGD